MRLKVIRDKIAWLVASKEGKKNLTEGVTDDNFYDFSFYVDLIAKTLRRYADDSITYTMGWRYPIDDRSTQEEMDIAVSKPKEIFNKWADILSIADIDLMDEPYYKPYWDRIDAAVFEPLGNGGSTLRFPEKTAEIEEIQRSLEDHEHAIHMLQVDILMELAEHHRYMWD